MKRKNYLFILFLLFCGILRAQLEECSHIPSSSIANAFYPPQSNFEGCEVQIKVYYHLYYDDNGGNGVPLGRPDDMTILLNDQYNGTGITFFYNDCETRIINDNLLDISIDECDFFFQNTSHDDGVDIHVKDDNNAFIGIASGIPGSELLLSGTWNVSGDPLSMSQTLGHEMGHCLGLFHTHHGTCLENGTDCYGNDIQESTQSVENGDYVTDTPRDPYLGGGGGNNVNVNCVWDGTITCDDSLGVFNPNTDNFMSYTRVTCRDNFTMGQITRMCELMLPAIIHTSTLVCCNLLEFDIELSSQSLSNACPDNNVDLNSLLITPVPEGTEIIWSQDGDPSDGLDSEVSNIVNVDGTFYAYYGLDNEETCLSNPSDAVIVSIEICCDNTEDIIISNNVTINLPTAFGGNVIVSNGATLTINEKVYFGEFTTLKVENGGILNLKVSAELNDCPEALRWQGIVIENGGTLISKGAEIHSAFYGVHAMSGSNINITSIDIFGDGTYDNARNGIWLDGNVNATKLNNLKIYNYAIGINANNSNNYYNISKGEISNCFTGIKLNNAPARINDFDITFHFDAINAFQSLGTLIENNHLNIVDNNYYSDSKGINIWWCDASIIRNNTIGNDWKAPSTGISLFLSNGGTINDMNTIRGGRTGIFAFNTDFSIIQNDISVVSDYSLNRGAVTLMYGTGNQILNNYIDAQNVTFGINTIMCTGTRMENNDITTSFNASYHRAAGIKSEGCNGEMIKDNLVNGSGNTDGIIATNTAGNTYDCNHATVGGSKEALSVLYNSQGQSVKGNTLTANGNDLLIRSIIGEQVHEGNEFVGGNTFAEDIDFAIDSYFYVNSNIAYHMPTNPVPIEWFRKQTDVQNYYICANSPGPTWIPFWDDEDVLCAYYNRVIDKYGYGSKEYIRMIQTMLRYGRQRINFDLPDCVKDDPILPDCWEALVNAEHELSTPNDDRETDRSDLLNEIVLLSQAYESGSGEAHLVNHKGDIVALSTTLSNADAELDLTIQNVKDILDGIDCTDSIISIALPILKEYILYLETEDKSTFDYTALINYSRLCADDYGPYIHLARGIVYPVTDEYFDQYDDCRLSEGGTRAAKEVNISSYIYPNPSSGAATLYFGNKTSGHIEVFDISGNRILRRILNDDISIDIDLSDYIGVNLIHIYHNDGATEVLKHISIK